MRLLFMLCLVALLLPGCGKHVAQSDVPETIKRTARSTTVSMVSVGDILLGNAAAQHLELHGYDWPFEYVRPLLSDADVVIGNLEGPITTAKNGRSNSAYGAKPASASALKRAGFHALSLANNHAMDFGTAGMDETIELLRAQDILPFGAGSNESQAHRGIVYDFGTLRIGLLGYADEWEKQRKLNWYAKGTQPGCALFSAENMETDIARMRKYADVVVISVHWGSNYKPVRKSQEKMGRRAIELGADIVCGHHPHIAQGIEIYRGKPIIYSVGNFVFGTTGSYEKDEHEYGLVSRWIFEGKSLKWLLTTPIAVNNKEVNFQPRRVDAQEAQRMFEPHLKAYGTPVRWQGDTAFIGFAPDWQTAVLPTLPWRQGATNAPTPVPETVLSID